MRLAYPPLRKVGTESQPIRVMLMAEVEGSLLVRLTCPLDSSATTLTGEGRPPSASVTTGERRTNRLMTRTVTIPCSPYAPFANMLEASIIIKKREGVKKRFIRT